MRGRRDKRIWGMLLGLFVMVFTFTFLVQKFDERQAEAANMSGFDPGYIISDYQMGNYNSMTEAQIQSFLKSKNPCNDANTWQTGNNVGHVSETTPYSWHVSGGHYVCMADEVFNGGTAAHIIWQAAQDYRINPQVLIVLLQKEQGLVTDTLPNSVQYRSATGFGCPDTAACSSKYYGFKNQVRNAAAMFRDVLDGGWTNYPLGNNYVRYSPNASCGGTTVNIRNRATSALYRYTPYQPNAAALTSSYGGGDSCSAYGNRNFYSYFEDWFGGIKQTQSSVKLPNGVYYIRSVLSSSMAVDVAGGSSANGANVQLYGSNKTAAQQWKITYNSVTDDYDVINVATGKALDVDGAGLKDGTNVQVWESNKSCAQRWKIVNTDGDNVKLISTCSTKALDIANASVKNGANIRLWSDNGTTAQKWDMIPVNTLEEEGLYLIQTKANDSRVLDISGGVSNAVSGSNVQIWSSNNTGAQRWKIKKATDGYYTINNLQSAKAVDVAAGAAKNYTNVQIYGANNTCAQRWKIMKNSDESYTFISACGNKVLDIKNGSTASGTNVQIYEANNSNAQKWNLKKAMVVENGEYEIASVVSEDKVLDIAGNWDANGTNVQIYSANGSTAQKWKVTYNVNTDYYSIVNPGTKKALDVAGAGTWGGVNVQIWGVNTTCAQKWSIQKDGTTDKYNIVSGCSNLMLDVKDASKSNGANIQLWKDNGSTAQKWVLK